MRRHIFAKACIAFVLLFAGAPAWSQEMPHYDVESWCHRVAKSVGAESAVIYDGCVQQEQSAYDDVKSQWPSLPAHTQVWCDKVARSTGGGSYQIMNGCIQQELSAAENKPKFQY